MALKKEEQTYYEKDGEWSAFNQPQPNLGEPKTYADFLESQKPTPEQQAEINSATAKTTRDNAIDADIELRDTGAIYQIDDAAQKNIERAKRKAVRNGQTSTMWRLADNTWRETTLDDIEWLINASDDRFEEIWRQFNLWDSGDKQEPFEV